MSDKPADTKPTDERAKELDDVRKVLELPQGRRYLWRLLTLAGVFRNPHSVDPASTSFNCGLQALGQTVLSDITEARDESLILMMREHQAAVELKRQQDEARERATDEG